MNEHYMSIGDFYANIVSNSKGPRTPDRALRTVTTKYSVDFDFPPEFVSVTKGSEGEMVTFDNISNFNELMNLLLQDMELPVVTYDGVRGGDVVVDSSTHGGYGGRFIGVNESDFGVAGEADLVMKFINTKHSIVEQFFIPWIEHSCDMQSAIRYGVYPFVRANLRVIMYDDTANRQDPEYTDEILTDITFYDVYPYQATMTPIQFSEVSSTIQTRTVNFAYNTFTFNRNIEASHRKLFQNRYDMVISLNEQVSTYMYETRVDKATERTLGDKLARNAATLAELAGRAASDAGSYLLDKLGIGGKSDMLDKMANIGDSFKWLKPTSTRAPTTEAPPQPEAPPLAGPPRL
jgi:hypothetical protein